MDYLEAIILDYLKEHGKASRTDLMNLTGLSDRENRRIIGRLRDKHEPIGLGYRGQYTYNVEADLKRITKEMDAKIYTMMRRSAAIKNRPLTGQMTIEEVLDIDI